MKKTEDLKIQYTLMWAYRCLLEAYGPQHWWPGDGAFEIMVGAVLTQSTSWSNVEKAIFNLKSANLLTPEGIRTASQNKLALLIRSSGYFNSKAKKLKALADFLWEEYEDNIEALRAEEAMQLRQKLLGIYGIGEETADDIVLYVAEAPTFVVDTYTRRLFSRLGIIEGHERYESLRQRFVRALPPDAHMLGEYHALIVRHSKNTCRKTAMLCNRCALQVGCEFARSIKAKGGS